MATTVADLIRGALRTLGVLAAEETASAAQEADALVTLNELIDSWAGERLTLWATARGSSILIPGQAEHSYGSGGDYPTTIVRIDAASITPVGMSGTEIPLRLLSDAEWQATPAKTSQGIPTSLWIIPDSVTTLYLNPIPNAAHTLVLYTWQQIVGLGFAADELSLPPGYLRALRSNLAVELAPEYGVSVSAELGNIAGESKANLKRLNWRPSYLRCDAAILVGGASNIVAGDS